jgi:hypothetical protein
MPAGRAADTIPAIGAAEAGEARSAAMESPRQFAIAIVASKMGRVLGCNHRIGHYYRSVGDTFGIAPTHLFEDGPRGATLDMMVRKAALVLIGALALVPAADARPFRQAGVIPQHGIFVVGKTLAGVGLNYTQTQVKMRWGSGFTLCTAAPLCTVASPVWLYTYETGEPLGVAVRFRNGKTDAVFTLGAVGVNSLSSGGGGGWKTAEGLHITDPISNIYSFYAAATIDTNCSFYSAISMRQGNVTSSFYTSSGTVYGFALTAAGVPICQ